MIYPQAVSDGQFYSPPESVAGDVRSSPRFSLLWGCVFSISTERFSLGVVPAGSEEDLDEEGLGRRAVTSQVPESA